MATVTTIGHINNAIRFTQKIGNIYVGIGLGGTSKTKDTISNLYGLRRAEMVSLARTSLGAMYHMVVISMN